MPLIVFAVAVSLAIVALTGRGDGSSPEPSSTDAGSLTEDDAATDATEQPSDQQADLASQLERRVAGDPLALGAVDAPVVMIEWADFQCPFCGTFARDTKPELMERYVDDGVLRIEWRDFPVLGDESRTAALAGRAAAEQDAFWALHDEIYSVERDRNAGELDREALIEMAGDLGLETDRFASDLDDPAVDAVQADLEIGQQLGITGTPAFLINGQPIMGGQPLEVFVQAIEQAAEAADTP